jgi:cell division protein FtsL
MVRLNMILVVLVLASALGVVASQHKARKLFTELEHEQSRQRALEVEWGQLQIEQSTWAGHARIEKAARERLKMVTPAQMVVIDGQGAAQ